MKKTILWALLLCAAPVVCGEDMKFVTLLSQPVGSFSTVKLTSNDPAKIYNLNFCNTRVSGGTIATKSVTGNLTTATSTTLSATQNVAVNITNFNVFPNYNNKTVKGGLLAGTNVHTAKMKVNGTLKGTISTDTAYVQSGVTMPGGAQFAGGSSGSVGWKQVCAGEFSGDPTYGVLLTSRSADGTCGSSSSGGSGSGCKIGGVMSYTWTTSVPHCVSQSDHCITTAYPSWSTMPSGCSWNSSCSCTSGTTYYDASSIGLDYSSTSGSTTTYQYRVAAGTCSCS